MKGLALVVLLVAPTAIAAADTAVVAALLKDEASECRYLARLCDRHREASRLRDQAREETQSGQAAYEKIKGPLGPPNKARDAAMKVWKDAADRLVLYGHLSDSTREDALEAANVMASKHETAPTCLNDCVDVLK